METLEVPMQNWNFIIKQLNLPESMYGFNNLMNLIGDSNSTVVLSLETLTTKIENLLFAEIYFTGSDNLILLNEFEDFTHTKRWEILFKYDVISYAVYKQVRDLISVFDQQTMLTTRALVIAINRLKYVIDAIADKKLFKKLNSMEELSTEAIVTTNSHKNSYDLFPSLEDIPLPIKMNTRVLESFWDIFIVHFDFDNQKFRYDLIKTMVKYNPDGALKKMNILFRFLGVARLNYLAESKSMAIGEPFGTPERLAHLSTEGMWEKIYNDYDLPIEEYEMAKKVSNVLKHAQVPKNIVADVFATFEQLVTKLFFVVKEQQDTKKVSPSVSSVERVKEMPQLEVSKAVIEERRERVILSTTSNAEIAASVHTPDKMEDKGVEISSVTNQTDESKKQPSKYGSLFLQKIKGLQKSSNETVVNANELGDFQSYMHVERKIERDTVAKLEEMQASSTPQLLLLLGSVGDGKSHLLAYLKATKPNLFNNVYIHNDATESYERTKPAEATLERILSPFEDGFVPKQHIVVAINYGKLHNFYLLQKEKGQFQLFTSYIDSLNIFNKTKSDKKTDTFESFHTVDFSKEKYYSINEKGVYSTFFSKILEKITAPEGVNEIYQAWLQDKSNNKWTMAHENYLLLMNEQVRKRIVEKIIHVIIRNKMIVSTREFYNFIVDLIVPSEILLNPQSTAFSLENSLPNLLFNHPERSAILFGLNELDPVFIKNSLNDELIASIFMQPDLSTYLSSVIGVDGNIPYDHYWRNAISLNEHLEVARFVIRLKELLNENNEQSDFSHFVKYLYAFYKGTGEVIEEVFPLLEKVVYQWKGSPRDSYAYLTNNLKKEFRMAIPMNLESTLDMDLYGSVEQGDLHASNHYITLGFNDINFDLDLKLFEILRQVSNGHRPNLHEVGQAIQFEDFYNKLIKYFEDKEKKLLMVHVPTNEYYEISKPKFSKAKFDVKKV